MSAYFGARYFGGRYFGGAVIAATPVPTVAPSSGPAPSYGTSRLARASAELDEFIEQQNNALIFAVAQMAAAGIFQ